MTSHIPSFKNPPLNEVFLGVQYDPIETFNIATYGALYDEFKENFPAVEHHMPIEPYFEKIGGRKQPLGELSRLKLEPLVSAQLPRAWFINPDGRALIQVQPDRFLRNWRRHDITDKYPRYENIRAEFSNNLDTLISFYQKNEIGSLKPNQCEISYINHIKADKIHSQLNDVFVGWSDKYDLSEIADVEDVLLNIKHTVKDSNGDFVGRLYVKVQPAFTIADDRPIFLIELTVRGRPLGEGLEGVLDFMDLGREKIVRAFTKMTTKEMHDLWEREA